MLICDALHKTITSFPAYSNTFVSNCVCAPDSEKCRTGKCDVCSQKMVTWQGKFQGPELNKEIFWYEWAREEDQNEPSHKRRKSATENGKPNAPKQKLMKSCRLGTVLAAIESLTEKLPEFLLHVFIKREQSNHFQSKLLSIPKGSAVIQVDFSENYTIQHQGEIQSAYWNQNQLTVFTIVSGCIRNRKVWCLSVMI